MTRKLEGSIHVGWISSNRGDDKVRIQLNDKQSGIEFVEIELTAEQFGRLIGSNGFVGMTYELRGEQNLGKKYVSEQSSAVIPRAEYEKLIDGVSWADRKAVLRQWLLDNCSRDGWHINGYLGSQGSITTDKAGDCVLNFNYYTYREETNE